MFPFKRNTRLTDDVINNIIPEDQEICGADGEDGCGYAKKMCVCKVQKAYNERDRNTQSTISNQLGDSMGPTINI